MSAATVDQQQRATAAKQDQKVQIIEAPIPEVVEEKRKDSNGRVVVINRYTRGNMLGKVSMLEHFYVL